LRSTDIDNRHGGKDSIKRARFVGSVLHFQTPSFILHDIEHVYESLLRRYLDRFPCVALRVEIDRARSEKGRFVREEILRQFNAAGVAHDAFHYRTSAGADIDLVLEGFFGLVPVEIKRGQKVELRELRSLKDFVQGRGCPFGVVINNDVCPLLYSEKIIGVPFACL
jgi:hypothetical protein